MRRYGSPYSCRQIESARSCCDHCGGTQGTDCMEAFGAMQQCLLRHPEAFADFVRSKSESDAEHDAAGEAG